MKFLLQLLKRRSPCLDFRLRSSSLLRGNEGQKNLCQGVAAAILAN